MQIDVRQRKYSISYDIYPKRTLVIGILSGDDPYFCGDGGAYSARIKTIQ